MNLKEARLRAISTLQENAAFQERYHPVILDEHTLATEFGWVFFYQSYDYIYKGDDRKMLVGNNPIMVDKDLNLVIRAGTSYDIDKYIDLYMKNRGNTQNYESDVNSLL